MAEGPASAATFEARLRFEQVDDDGFVDQAEATTLRVRAGYKYVFSPSWSAYAELEATAHLGDEDFNSTDNGRTAYPTVVDPDSTEINQARIDYTHSASTRVTFGRQRLAYGNHRFIGNVGWRQNEQTFDALDAQISPAQGFTLRYSYLDRVQRIFGEGHQNPNQARWNLDTHVIDASYKLGPGTLSGYAHLYDNQTLPLTSHKNFGVRYAAQSAADATVGWQASVEATRQRPYAEGADINRADYFAVEGGVKLVGNTFSAGIEQLGGDGRYGFQTPLATLHAFNGWADRFLTTPVNGLDDRYIGWKRGFGDFNAQLVYHDYQADRGGADYGSEWGAALGWAFAPKWNALFKYSNYDSDGFGADVDKLWLSVEFKL
ncbi:alginate export family protein [Pseudoxanthomonas sp. CAU 1598]|uniref:Alginate export family protein n=2 Tax=Pseudomarimonas arenosa TaxID=2774145 RepID=A0AAW3ZTL4_9GAMM|nr:alginate export family protein [Pseudomarimonas arenosa]